MNITTHLYALMMMTVFAVGACSGQGFINENDFEDKIAKDIVAVEFWAEWNKQNEFAELSKLKDTNVFILI